MMMVVQKGRVVRPRDSTARCGPYARPSPQRAPLTDLGHWIGAGRSAPSRKKPRFPRFPQRFRGLSTLQWGQNRV